MSYALQGVTGLHGGDDDDDDDLTIFRVFHSINIRRTEIT
jgi:hypothetical protein